MCLYALVFYALVLLVLVLVLVLTLVSCCVWTRMLKCVRVYVRVRACVRPWVLRLLKFSIINIIIIIIINYMDVCFGSMQLRRNHLGQLPLGPCLLDECRLDDNLLLQEMWGQQKCWLDDIAYCCRIPRMLCVDLKRFRNITVFVGLLACLLAPFSVF